MPKVQYIGTLSREEYDRLKDLADIEGVSLEDFIRQLIRKLLRKRPRPFDFTKDPSYGIWKDVSKTDEELLNELGGNWENFPLEEDA